LSRLKPGEQERPQNRLYDTKSGEIDDDNNKDKFIGAYISELEMDSPYIQILNNPQSNILNISPELQHTFYGINQIGAKYIRRPIIAACREWGKKDLRDPRIQELSDCLLKSFFMYKTVGDKSIDVVRKMARSVTQMIMSDPSNTSEIFKIVLDNPDIVRYINKQGFKDDFAYYVEELDPKPAKYILMSLEHELNKPGGISLNLVNSETQLEHIFPQNAKSDDWPNLKDLEDHINRLGNLTLMPKKWNIELSNHSYSDKLNGVSQNGSSPISYKKSGFKLNKIGIGEISDVWNRDSMEDRERELCEIANRIWDLNTYRNKYCET
ncbi:MAG: HNH endonuclease family protein, partial [Alphaproteobacteria bacterium]|nr:HNH endonuclease family protein [Alphaproteobacteria bacterium]